MTQSIVKSDVRVAERVEGSNEPVLPRLGQWYWVRDSWSLGWRAEETQRYVDDVGRGLISVKEGMVEGELLMVVAKLGSNFVELVSPQLKRDNYSATQYSKRVHLDELDVLTFEPDGAQLVQTKVAKHRREVGLLLSEIQDVTARLGVGQQLLSSGSHDSTGSLVRATGDKPVKAFKDALTQAKTKTLPELFAAVELENRYMAMWLMAELIPLKLEAEEGLKPIIERIDGRIFNVELYAGLVEQVKLVRDGEPAAVNEPIHLMQRRCYMDEECISAYDATNWQGIDATEIDARFDRWLSLPENFERILPFPRCVVAFKVRRFAANYKWEGGDAASLLGFISWSNAMKEANEQTFLYLRNGERLYRLDTKVEFEEELFPDEQLRHLTGTLYAKVEHDKVQDVITEGDWLAWKARYTEEQRTLKARQAAYDTAVAAWRHERRLHLTPGGMWDVHVYLWRRLRMAEGLSEEAALKYTEVPHHYSADKPHEGERIASFYELRRKGAVGVLFAEGMKERCARAGVTEKTLLSWYNEHEAKYAEGWRCDAEEPKTPDSGFTEYAPFTDANVYYDEVQGWLGAQRERHNRLVLILQGLLDRSETFHPHPKWQLWTETGFAAGLVLHYDSKRALNATELPPDFEAWRAEKNASIRVGSLVAGADFWWEREEAEKAEEREERYSSKQHDEAGPGRVARVVAVRGGKVTFEWLKRTEFGGHRERWRGWVVPPPRVTRKRWSCPVEKVLCLDTYEAREMWQFYRDPRSRMDFMKWAPYLITAEQYVAGQVSVQEPPPKKER